MRWWTHYSVPKCLAHPVRFDPENYDARSNLVDALRKNGRMEESVDALRDWVTFNPEVGLRKLADLVA